MVHSGRMLGLADATATIAVSGDRTPAVLIGEARLLADTHEALAAIGATDRTILAWADIAAGRALPGRRSLIVVEAQGAAEDVLAAALPRIDAAAQASGSPVVVSLPAPAIDVVAATLLGPQTQLLCDPTLGDRTAALALAARSIGQPAISDTAFEGEAARLRRLNEEVARIAEVLSRLSRREAAEPRPGIEVADRRQSFGVEPAGEIVIDPAEVRRAIRARRMRDPFFGTGLFEEPGWDMMLDLFAAELEGARVSVSSLCIAAAVAPTTALRWISKLTEAGLFERRPDPFDRRRAFMELSERASRAMRDYVAALRRAGLSLG